MTAIPHFIRLDFAHTAQTVFLVMAVIMAVAAFVALSELRSGRLGEAPAETDSTPLLAAAAGRSAR